MKVLFLCGGYYPNTSATGNCVRRIADMFTSNGNEVYVISKSGDENSSQDIINDQFVYRITNKRLSEAAKLTKESRGLKTKVKMFLYKSRWAVTQLMKKDGLDNSLVDEYVKQGIKICDEHQINAIVPCCMPAECLFAGYQLCGKYKSIKLFPLLYDPYSENVNFFRFKWSHAMRKDSARKVEKKVFDNSEVVFYVDNWKSYFSIYRQSNSVRVEHPLVIRRKPAPVPLEKKNRINAIYQGEINQQMRPPEAMLEAFKILSEKDSEISLHICAYGNSVPAVIEATKQCPQNIIFYGKVQKDIADGLYDDSNIAVILANKNSVLVPSKIFECIASGFPIIYFYYTKEENAYKLLSEYPLVYFISQKDRDDLSYSSLLEWIKTNYMKHVDFNDVSEIYSDATPDFVVNEIEKRVSCKI